MFLCCLFFSCNKLAQCFIHGHETAAVFTDSVHLVKITFIIIIPLNPWHLVMFTLFYFPFSLFLSFDGAC